VENQASPGSKPSAVLCPSHPLLVHAISLIPRFRHWLALSGQSPNEGMFYGSRCRQRFTCGRRLLPPLLFLGRLIDPPRAPILPAADAVFSVIPDFARHRRIAAAGHCGCFGHPAAALRDPIHYESARSFWGWIRDRGEESRSLSTSMPVPANTVAGRRSSPHRCFRPPPFDQVDITLSNSRPHFISVPRRQRAASLPACAVF